MTHPHKTPDRQASKEHKLSALLFAWMRRPGSMRVALIVFAVLSIVLIALEFVTERHAANIVESLPGFFGFFALIAFALIVLSVRPLARLLRRNEAYYRADQEEGDDDR